MGLKSLLTTLALSAFALGMNAQTGSLSFGDYDSVSEWDDYDGGLGYALNFNTPDVNPPINFGYINSGYQIILKSSDLSSLKGKNITSLAFRLAFLESYGDFSADIKIYITETSIDTFEKPKKYLFFDKSLAKPSHVGTVEYDGWELGAYYAFAEETVLEFSTPYYYSGENNLIITICSTSTGDSTNSNGYISTYYGNTKNMLSFADDKISFEQILEGDRERSYSPDEAPMMAIGYESATAPDATYKTFVTSCDVDFTAIKGIEAYKVASVGSNSLQLEAIESAKAGTPVILKTNVQPSFTTGTATAVSDNMLQASDGTVTSDGTFYCLATKNGVQAFYPVASGVKIPKGKAYIQIAGGAAKMNIALDDVTAISTTTTTQKSDAVYNLQGQRTEAAKGIFIVGGKKVIKK